jgi:hypothetical protein
VALAILGVSFDAAMKTWGSGGGAASGGGSSAIMNGGATAAANSLRAVADAMLSIAVSDRGAAITTGGIDNGAIAPALGAAGAAGGNAAADSA